MSAINSTTIDFLLSAAAQRIAADLYTQDLTDNQTLALLSDLRKCFSATEAGALLTLARLRQRATVKFPQAHRLFFTPTALEQATAWPIAQHRAAHVDRTALAGPVLDLGCGIGGDTLALAQHRPVIAYETDPVRLRCAQANAAALNLADRIDFRQADWTADLAAGTLPTATAAFADPSRRVDDRRVFSLHQMQPPLAALLALQARIPALGVKVMPGVADEEVPARCVVEFISHAGVCKEAVLWFGPLRTEFPAAASDDFAPRRASIHLADGWHHITAAGAAPPVGPLRVGQFLHEPDPAVIRAGAFAELCAQLDAQLFDRQIAYLVSSQARTHPLTQSFVIHEIQPFNLKQVNRRLRAWQIGRAELKKRGVPIEPEALRRRLKFVSNGQAAVLIFTRRGDERLVLICQRVATFAES